MFSIYFFLSLNWPGWPPFSVGDEGTQTNVKTLPQIFFQRLSLCNGMTAASFEDPVDYFGTELLLLFLFDMLLMFAVLQLNKITTSVHVFY